MKKDEMRINYFVRTSYSLHCVKYEADDLIKPQGVNSKIVAPDSLVEESVKEELMVPASSFYPEEIVLVNINLDICDEETAVSVSTDNN